MDILRRIFSSNTKRAATVALVEDKTESVLTSPPSNDEADKKKSSKKKRKSSKISIDPAIALAEARAADAAAQLAISQTSKKNVSQKPQATNSQNQATTADSGSQKTHMGVSRSHKKILLDYQTAREKPSDEVIGEVELEALNNAKAYFLEQNWDIAIDKLSLIIEGHPSWIDPWVLLMDCFFELKEWERCIELAEELEYFHPDNVSVPCYQATALRELNRTKEGIFVCNQAIELFPSSYFLLTIKGDCFFKEGNFKLANESYNRALKIEKFIDGTQKAISRDVVPWARQKWRAQITDVVDRSSDSLNINAS